MSLTVDIAAKLNGIEYDDLSIRRVNAVLNEIYHPVYRQINDIVVAFPSSDDLVDFCGAFVDESYHNGSGTKIYLSGDDQHQGRILHNLDALPGQSNKIIQFHATCVMVKRDEKDHAICLSLDHYNRLRAGEIGKFDIMEDGERYGQGIVFSLRGLKYIPSPEEVYEYWFNSNKL